MDGQRRFRPANLEKASIMRGERIRNAVCISFLSGIWHTNYKIAFYLRGSLENKIKKLCFALLCFGYNDCTVLFLRCQMGKGVRGRRRGVWKKREYNTNSILIQKPHIMNLALVLSVFRSRYLLPVCFESQF